MNKLLVTSSMLAIIVGIIMVLGGAWAILFTYQSIAQEKIVTPADATIPNAAVRGPFTLESQAGAIRKHVLEMTNGKTYAEMPREISQVDKEGRPVLDKNGKAVMIKNSARDIWITATSLITALHLGIITYLFASLIVLFGLVSIWTGIVLSALSKKIT